MFGGVQSISTCSPCESRHGILPGDHGMEFTLDMKLFWNKFIINTFTLWETSCHIHHNRRILGIPTIQRHPMQSGTLGPNEQGFPVGVIQRHNDWNLLTKMGCYVCLKGMPWSVQHVHTWQCHFNPATRVSVALYISCKIQNPKCKIQNSKSKMPNPKSWIQIPM